MSEDSSLVSVPAPKRRFEKFKPVLNFDKIGSSPRVPPAPQVNTKYTHKISESGNFIISGEDGTGQIKVGDSGIQVEGKQVTHETDVETESVAIHQVDTVLEDFKKVRKLGSGAQGSVDKVKNIKTQEVFARKTFALSSSINASPKMVIAEFRSLYECNCKNIIRMFHAFHKDGFIYLILELMNCGSLDDVIQTVGQIPEQIIHKMCVQILNGLDYLHTERKIVHRDLKPANILLNDKGIVKIADFGMAGHNDKTDIFTTYQGSALYMSPERIRSKPHTYNSDIWSLGVTLAEAALGEPLFPPNEFYFLSFTEDMPLPKLDKCTPEFRDFIHSCLMIDPGKRKSARELLHHQFIHKYYKSKPTLQSWLRKEYIPRIRKERKKSTDTKD